tara:strand:- start:727 stop:1317 length:591 start_codon:yes stop_codon:yes gene_type:complete
MSHQPHDQNRKDLDDLAGRRSAYSRPRSRKMQPNDRVQRSAATLLDLGVPVTAAVHHLREQLDAIGYPSTARSGPAKLHDLPDPANPDADTTGDSALHAYEAGKMKEDLRDAITDIEKRINALARLVVKITNEPLPGLDGVALCSDRQHGREGVEAWGDPACSALPVRSGMCWPCYQRERKYRAANDLADRSEPAA